MTKSDVTTLLDRYPRISDQVDRTELMIILTELASAIARRPSAHVVEFGCYIGTSSLFMRRVMDMMQSIGEFHVYDSFAGLPEKTSYDRSPAGEQFRAGELSVSKKQFITQFKKAGLQLPVIHRSWFHDLTPADVPDGITFAFLDGDYYGSIRDSLRLITPKLLPGATIIVDDYVSDALPGAAKAVDEWRRSHHMQLRVMASLAVMINDAQ